jgi:hypothetical protein
LGKVGHVLRRHRIFWYGKYLENCVLYVEVMELSGEENTGKIESCTQKAWNLLVRRIFVK